MTVQISTTTRLRAACSIERGDTSTGMRAGGGGGGLRNDRRRQTNGIALATEAQLPQGPVVLSFTLRAGERVNTGKLEVQHRRVEDVVGHRFLIEGLVSPASDRLGLPEAMLPLRWFRVRTPRRLPTGSAKTTRFRECLRASPEPNTGSRDLHPH
ncbi:unnamed protein product [Schistocephalus solidus]|uniref:Uncharacterized protein n=1 Tax=Schistocephalus solidus TaxID=70667 RepID=A0A183SV73_SCHSO|nr:unnamed protein product [Schistocephalus solidus]